MIEKLLLTNLLVKQVQSFFRNNCIHKGGHPEKNHERLAIIFNIYPHEDKPDYDDWFKRKTENLRLSENTEF